MRTLITALLLWNAAVALAGPPEDLTALRAFYESRFPEVPLLAHKDGSYALDMAKREQWLAMEEFPPYEIAVDDGEELYDRSFPGGGGYGDCLGDDAPSVKHRFPYFDLSSGQVVTLEQTLNNCRQKAGLTLLDYDGEEMAALMAHIAMESRGVEIAIEIPDDPRALAAYEAGKRFYYERRGQLNFSCSSCHLQNVGMMLRAERLSAAVGHTTHWPVYRGKWERVGVLHRRFQECNSQVRAEPLPQQSESYRNLEYFLSYMNTGMELNGPGTRK
ncbi:MAG: sulfur-oxidizing protein SoxA [Halieaceae bacterium]|jgi:sulfur-oxidizing protein SoxA